MGKAEAGRRHYLIYALLAVLTIAIYWQVMDFQFVNFDDDVYVEKNPMVQAGFLPAAVQYAFISPYEANYIPLVWISYMADHDFGIYVLDSNSAGIYHATNALLHLINVLLLFLVLSRLTRSRWRSAFVAALFAIHPLHVESVAWVSERKDVLSTLFWMLTMLAYLRYHEHPNTRRYLLLLLTFVMGLLAKSMLVSLPLVLLMLDYWPLNAIDKEKRGLFRTNLRRSILDKFPLFALAGVGCGVTIWAQERAGAVANVTTYPIGVRLANSIVACVTYILKMFWPVKLSFFYPHPGTTLPVWQVIGSALLLIGLTTLAIRLARTRPYFMMGWLWYVVTLLPVIGLVQVGKQAMADRYTYIPLIGLFIIIAWGFHDLFKRRVGRTVLASISIVVILALNAAAYIQVGYWRDSITLCKHALAINEANPLAHFNLGSALKQQGDTNTAIREFRAAIKLIPDYYDAHYNLASTLAQEGKYDEASRHFVIALRICPNSDQVHNNWGVMLAQQEKFAEAIPHFAEAVRLNPNNQSAKNNLENARARMQGMP